MQPAEVIRQAAEVIRSGGWSQGAAARDALGREVPLYADTAGGESRGRINPAAVSFSVYGAIAKVLAQAGSSVPQAGLMWETLSRLATIEMGGAERAHGGTGYLHPVMGYNEGEDRTKEQALAFLEAAAANLEPAAPNSWAEPALPPSVSLAPAPPPVVIQPAAKVIVAPTPLPVETAVEPGSAASRLLPNPFGEGEVNALWPPSPAPGVGNASHSALPNRYLLPSTAPDKPDETPNLPPME